MSVDRFLGREFTINDPVPVKGGTAWTHGRCVKVVRRGSLGRVAWIRLLFPDGTERSFRPSQLKRVVIGYPEARAAGRRDRERAIAHHGHVLRDRTDMEGRPI